MAEVINVDAFVAQFNGGGARPNLYKVELFFPLGINFGDNQKQSMLIKAASLPESTMGQAIVPFMGRQIKVAGDKTFADWTITVINDTDFATRRAFEEWHYRINAFEGNTGLSNPSEYYSDIIVKQLNRNGEVIYQYKLYQCYPTSIGEVTLGYDQNDTVEEFTVTLSMNYFTSDGAPD